MLQLEFNYICGETAVYNHKYIYYYMVHSAELKLVRVFDQMDEKIQMYHAFAETKSSKLIHAEHTGNRWLVLTHTKHACP